MDRARDPHRHVHLPDAVGFLEADEGVHQAHAHPDGRLYWAGAYVDQFSLSHPGAMASGVNAALSVGARVGPGFFAYDHNDGVDFADEMRRSHGKNLGPPSKGRANKLD